MRVVQRGVSQTMYVLRAATHEGWDLRCYLGPEQRGAVPKFAPLIGGRCESTHLRNARAGPEQLFEKWRL